MLPSFSASAAKRALERTYGGNRERITASDTSVELTQTHRDPREPSTCIGEDDDGRAAGLQLEPRPAVEDRGRYAPNA